jgi:ribosome-binding protein aMBF1 (putative translation factor)
MPSDVRVAAAREQHRAAADAVAGAAQHREARDGLIRAAYADGGWSYAALAGAVGCSPELVAAIVRGRRQR